MHAPVSKPTDLTAPGALAQLFAYNRQVYGGWSMEDTGGDQGGSGTGSGDDGANGGDQQGGRNATDPHGNDLGFPKETPVAQMTDKEQAAYWRNNARKHEGLWKGVAGDRKLDDVKADLDAYAEVKKSQMTPADQALTERYDQGKAEGVKAARTETAATIFRGALEAGNVPEADIDDLVANLNVANFVTDTGVDTTKITNFAKKFTPAGTGGQQQKVRDFGAGDRGKARAATGSVAQVMADRAAARATKNPTSTS